MTPRRVLPALLLLFVGSGCAALIYEIVWFQLLQLVIGSSAVSMGVLLGTFMGGMCLGSLFLPRAISSSEHPLRVYAYLELAIGVAGILLLFTHVDAEAQCSMCRAALNNAENSRLVRAINMGVLVLLIPPVTIFVSIFVLLRRYRGND